MAEKQKTILIIEDEPTASRAGAIFLNKGFKVHTAVSRLEGLKKQNGMPDIILLDIIMPVMDGVAASKNKHRPRYETYSRNHVHQFRAR